MVQVSPTRLAIPTLILRMAAFGAAVATALFFFSALVSDGYSAEEKAPRLRLWNDKSQKEWWAERREPGQLVEGAAKLLVALRDAEEKQGLARCFSNPHFTNWLAHLRWVRMFPTEHESHAFFSKEKNVASFRALSAIKGLSALVAKSLSSHDDPTAALEVLCRIHCAHADDLAEFKNLAVALAVVWDQPLPESWPHANVTMADIPVGDLEPEKRFAFYVASQKAGKLLLDPRSLTVRELTFIVDTPIELRELAYVQQVKIKNISKLEQLYAAVPYDNGRITGRRYSWPHGRYRLIDIGKKGGICMDQSYFVAHAGKSLGVPTVNFMGQGRSGDHSWVGFLTGRGRWTLDAARWRGENYPIGIAFDPQTWRRFTDQQMEFSIKGEGDSPSVARGKLILAWAAMNAERENYPTVLKAAASAMPRVLEPWELHAEWLASSGAEARVRRAFWERWVSNFSGERDLKAKGQRALLRVLRELGDERGAERLTRQIVSENKSKRFDLGIAVAADGVFAHQEAEDWTAAAKEYERVMKRFSRNAGGHLFYNLVQPYVQTAIREGRAAEARAAIAIAEGIMKPEPQSILANDLKKLRDETR